MPKFAAEGGGGGGGGGDKAASPAAARLDRRSHMMSELVAAAGDWGFGPTSERWAGGRWMAICEATLRHVAMAMTTEVGFPPLLPFFESFLEISL